MGDDDETTIDCKHFFAPVIRPDVIEQWSNTEIRLDDYLITEIKEFDHLQQEIDQGKPIEYKGETTGHQHVGMTYLQPSAGVPRPPLPSLPDNLSGLPLRKTLPSSLPGPLKDGKAAAANAAKGLLNGFSPNIPQLPTGLPTQLPSLPNFPTPPQLPTLPTALPSLPNIAGGVVPHIPGVPIPKGIPKLPKFPSELPSLPAMPWGKKAPSTATLWSLFKKKNFGFNSAFSASDGLFSGLDTEGYLDINPRLGIDYALHAMPSGNISADVELTTQVPKSLLTTKYNQKLINNHSSSPQFTHHINIAGFWPDTFKPPKITGITQQKSCLKLPFPHNTGHAKLELKKKAHFELPELRIEVGPKGGKPIRNALFNNNNNNTATATATATTTTPSSSTNGTANSSSEKAPAAVEVVEEPSDDDDEDMTANRPVPLHMPAISVELLPSKREKHRPTAACNVQWRQAWATSLRSNLTFRSQSDQLSVDVRSQPVKGLQMSGALSVAHMFNDPSARRTKLTARARYRLGRPFGVQYVVQSQLTLDPSAGVSHMLRLKHQRPRDDVKAALEFCMSPGEVKPKISLKYDVSMSF